MSTLAEATTETLPIQRAQKNNKALDTAQEERFYSKTYLKSRSPCSPAVESWPWAVLLTTMGVLMTWIYHKEPRQQFSKTICVSSRYPSCWRYDHSRIPEVPYERAWLAGNSVWDEEHQCHQTAWVWHPIQLLFPDIKLTVPITHHYSCVIKSIIASFERR